MFSTSKQKTAFYQVSNTFFSLNRIHISVQIPHQDGMLPLVSTMPIHNLHFLLSESIYRQQHVCSNLVTLKDLHGISGERSPVLDQIGSKQIQTCCCRQLECASLLVSAASSNFSCTKTVRYATLYKKLGCVVILF